MKKKYYCFMVVAFSIFYLSSCEKESSVERGELVPAVTNLVGDTNYLDKIIMRDTSIFNGSNIVDSSAFVFYYDVQKRLNLVAIKSLSNSLDSEIYLKPFYNQNDSLPYKVFFAPDSSTYYFFYDNVGRLIRDSVENIFGAGVSGVRNLNYSGNKIYAQLFSVPNIITPHEKDTFTLDSRGNLINSKFYIKTIGTTYELASSTNAVFDNGPTPYLKTLSFRIFSFSFGTFHHEAYYNNFGANNILVDIYNRHPYTGSGPIFYPSDTTSVVNSYYQNGLLKNVKGYRSTWTYIYKSL